MLKHLAIPALGFVVLAGASAPAVADTGVYVGKPAYKYNYTQSDKVVVVPQKSQKKYNRPPKLDFETEAVWRNLRPSWFVGAW